MVNSGTFYKYPPHAGWCIGKSVRIGPGCYFDVPPKAKLVIGNRVKLTKDVVLSSANGVEIGEDSLIAEFVSIRDSSHTTEVGTLINTQALQIGTIFIGKDVWLGKGATVLGDVEIEDGVVLGVNSLVKNTRLAKNTVYIGVPARELRAR